MKADELMIGNYILLCGEVGCITSGFIADYDFSEKNNFGENTPIRKEDIAPIPITEEWLLKFGFEKTNRVDFGILRPCYTIFSFALMIRHDSYYFDWIGGNTEVKYIHTLQNAYYILTGEKFTIKENK